MTVSRREFLQCSAAAAALAATGLDLSASPAKVPTKKILILGGTGFLGPATIEIAQARGHQITMFNRGKTRPDLFPGVEKLHGDRDPKKGTGLKALETGTRTRSSTTAPTTRGRSRPRLDCSPPG
jgi:2'-hydroxyisoflavone reductase